MSKGGGTCIKNAAANSVVVKQRWLFCILILILFVISANIGITALLLYYINVTNNSIGEIQFFGGHTLIRGQVFVEKSLTSASIKSSNKTLHFLSRGDFNIESHCEEQVSAMLIGTNSSIITNQLRMTNKKGEEYLVLGQDNAKLSFRDVTLTGKAQSISSLQASKVFSHPSKNLRFSSPTKSLSMTSGSDINLSSTGGNLRIDALTDILLDARNVEVRAEQVFLPKLLTNQGLNTTSGLGQGRFNSFEVCICFNGKIFAALQNQGCHVASRHICGA